MARRVPSSHKTSSSSSSFDVQWSEKARDIFYRINDFESDFSGTLNEAHEIRDLTKSHSESAWEAYQRENREAEKSLKALARSERALRKSGLKKKSSIHKMR